MAQQIEHYVAWLKPKLPWIVPIAVAVLVVLWLTSGVYTVNPGYVGVVRTFGKETARTDSGLNFRFPWPFQQVDLVSVEKVHRIEIGVQAGRRVPEEALMLRRR